MFGSLMVNRSRQKARWAYSSSSSTLSDNLSCAHDTDRLGVLARRTIFVISRSLYAVDWSYISNATIPTFSSP